YLHLYPTFGDTPTAITTLTATDLSTFLIKQSRRVINYIRGSDCANSTSPETCNAQPLTVNGTAVNGTAMRSRQYDSETWRLGDIIYSTPTLVGRPAEGYHLLYRDKSYAAFAARYQKRRNVIYTGANDGMVHAFNGGFFDSRDNKFLTSIEEPFRDANGNNTWDSGEVFTDWDGNGWQNTTMDFDLGAELWAYVPFNLLPHLYWLTESSYDEKTHVYYVDQKPRIFDARIFFQPGTTAELDADHPNGWGTIMVVGMRFGGGSIAVDMDKTDGAYDPNVDPTMKSAFMIFDITNPEKAPKLLAEITMPEMGFATSYPTVVIMMDGDKDKNYKNISTITPEPDENKWFLAFGSGPADANGNPGTVLSNGAYDNTILATAESQQYAGFYMLDLVKLVTDNELWTLTDGSGPSPYQGALDPGLYRYVTLDADSFVSAPVTVDYDLDYNADALYFGTISGAAGSWGGKLQRIIIDNDNNPINWLANDTLIDVAQPITAAPSVGVDDDGRNWVFFGPGRYFNIDDKTDITQQSYYGIKEPIYDATHPSYDSANPLAKSWDPVTKADLVDVTNYEVYTDSTVTDTTGSSSVTDWNDLVTEQSGSAGWFLDFPDPGERNLGQAALIGGLLSFTTFTPESNVCNTGGSSNLWALYYKTGTAHYSGVLNTGTGPTGDLALRKM
ncbi:MAG: hypothetical protein L3J79_12930, partial [Candidatus Marinimicrobia bacterium]|nr:hypothetical protein [Candidatus Neomarinimicrobiota bacterium]